MMSERAGVTRASLVMWLLVLALVLTSPVAAEDMARPGHPGWQAAKGTGCLVWNAGPIAGSQVSWSGPCENGRVSGEGDLVWSWDGKRSVYIGAMRDGDFNGQGTLTYPNGTRYEGEFVDGKFNGQGTITFANGNRYEGEWVDNEFNGQGIVTLANGDRYKGTWKGSKFAGPMLVTKANGDRYEGDLAHDVPNLNGRIEPSGRGKMTKANGDWYEGEWRGGFADREGEAEINGKSYKGMWARGCLLGTKQRAVWEVPRNTCP